MPEEAAASASTKILDVGVVGACCILLILAVIFLIMWIRSILKDMDEAKQAHLDDVKKYAAEGEATRAVLAKTITSVETHTETTKAMIELFRSERMRS